METTSETHWTDGARCQARGCQGGARVISACCPDCGEYGCGPASCELCGSTSETTVDEHDPKYGSGVYPLCANCASSSVGQVAETVLA